MARVHIATGVAGLILALAAPACGGGEEEGSGVGPGLGDGGDGTGGGADDDGADPKLDVAEGETGGDDPEGESDTCREVDFLFVVDSSNSMETNQMELVRSFPEFSKGIESDLEGVISYHVGVVTSDAYAFNAAGCTEIGALVTQTGGLYSSSQACGPYTEGYAWMSAADDLDDAFSCAAAVGTEGANEEHVVEAAMRAVSPDLNAAGACNEGFIRDGALLVLTFITDEDDPGTCTLGGACGGTDGEPADWYQHFVDLKGGKTEDLVGLALVRGAEGNACEDAKGSEKDGERIMELVDLFGDRGLVGDICADSFGPFFRDAIALIDSACAGEIG